MPKVAKNIELNDTQKKFVDEHIDMDLRELARRTFNDQSIDLKRVEVKTIRRYIAGKGTTAVEQHSEIKLTEDQREHIRNNYQSSSALEIARILSNFGQRNMRLDHPWVTAVQQYIRHIDPGFNPRDAGVESEYVPPRTLSDGIRLVNMYAINPRGDGTKIYDTAGKITPSDRRNVQTLIDYMAMPLFVVQIGKYTRKKDRDLFEAEFVKIAWDKPDLSGEELTQYITFVSETVKYTQIEQQAQLVDEQINNALLTDDDKDVKMAKVELLNSIREKANASLKQQAALLKSLVGDRSKRLNEKIAANGSMHNLVESWRKKEDREKIIRMNQLTNKAALKKEIERLSDMDSLKAEIFGLSADNILI